MTTLILTIINVNYRSLEVSNLRVGKNIFVKKGLEILLCKYLSRSCLDDTVFSLQQSNIIKGRLSPYHYYS